MAARKARRPLSSTRATILPCSRVKPKTSRKSRSERVGKSKSYSGGADGKIAPGKDASYPAVLLELYGGRTIPGERDHGHPTCRRPAPHPWTGPVARWSRMER